MPVTTSTQYGRAKIFVPDFQHEPGNTLHQKLSGTYADKYGFKSISDYLNCVWYSQTLPASSTVNIVHNFNLSYTSGQLAVLIWQGGSIKDQTYIDANFSISEVDLDTISIQNISASAITFQVMVMAMPMAHYINDVLQVIGGASKGIDTRVSGVLQIGHTLATDVDIGRSSQFQTSLGRHAFALTTDSTTTGTAATAALPDTSFVRLTNASLVSIAGITAPSKSMLLVLTNATGASVNVLNEDTSATAANRIVTGSGAPIVFANGASLFFIYDTSGSRWRVAGGAGGGAFAVKALQTITSGGTISVGAEGFQVIRVQGSSAPVNASSTPFGTTPPPDGTIIALMGNDSTNTVTILHNDAANGCWLNGDATLAKGSYIELQYLSSVSRYVERFRNGILGL